MTNKPTSNTYENYILNLISDIDKRIKILNSDNKENKFTRTDYLVLLNRLIGQKDVLLMILTAHDNPQSKFSIVKK